MGREGLERSIFQAEQAVPQLAVGRDPEPVAAHAERLADRGDQADPANAVCEYELGRRRMRVLVAARGSEA